MRRTLSMALAALTLSGCTVFQEVMAPHQELKSPCACAEDAAPINHIKRGVA